VGDKPIATMMPRYTFDISAVCVVGKQFLYMTGCRTTVTVGKMTDLPTLIDEFTQGRCLQYTHRPLNYLDGQVGR
jgi:hypothetical protein